MFTKSKIKPLISISLRRFEILSASEYLENYTNSSNDTKVTWNKMPLFEVDGHVPQNTTFRLYSVPQIALNHNVPLLVEASTKQHIDLVFIQMDPMPYITRQRFLSHKCALNSVEDYSVKATTHFDIPKLMTWEEGVVDLTVLDMAEANNIHTNLDYSKGFTTFSFPSLQEEGTSLNLHEKFIKSITNNVIGPNWSPYFEINHIVYQGLMGNSKVLLGDMPEQLNRLIIGNLLPLADVKDIVRSIAEKVREVEDLTLRETTLLMYSHIFLARKDLYMTALMKNALRASYSMIAFVGNVHYKPIQKYWQPVPTGITYKEASQVPKRLENETDSELIEKQAIFDVLLETKVWGEKYVINAFPYLCTDITAVDDDTLNEWKKEYFVNYKKYKEILSDLKPKKIVHQRVKSLSSV